MKKLILILFFGTLQAQDVFVYVPKDYVHQTENIEVFELLFMDKGSEVYCDSILGNGVILAGTNKNKSIINNIEVKGNFYLRYNQIETDSMPKIFYNFKSDSIQIHGLIKQE